MSKIRVSLSLDPIVLSKIDKLSRQMSIVDKSEPNRSKVINFFFRSKFTLVEYIDYLKAMARDKQKDLMRVLDLIRTAEQKLEEKQDPAQKKLLKDPKIKISPKKSVRS